MIANNLDQATKELNKLDQVLVEKLNTEVKEANKNHYHVIMLRIRERSGQIKNEVSLNVQHYNKRGFEKLKKNFQLHCNKMIVLHDPEQNEEKVKVGPPQHIIQKTESEIRAEVQKEADAEVERRVQERLKEIEDQSNQDSEEDEDGLIDLKDIRSLNLEGLVQYAEVNEIDLEGKTKVKDIKPIVITWAKAENQKAKEQA